MPSVLDEDPQPKDSASAGQPHRPAPDDSPHDGTQDEPLGPATPDDDTPLGDTPEAHDEITAHDLPLDHPGRAEAIAQAGGDAGTTIGSEDPSDTDVDDEAGRPNL